MTDLLANPGPAGRTGRPAGLAPALAGQVRYQMLLMLRTPRALVAGLMLPLVLLALRGGHQSAHAEIALLAGLTVLGVISTAYLTHASGLVTAREDGVLRRWWATPLPRWCFFAGRITATVLLSVAGTVVTVLAGVSFYGVALSSGSAVGLLVTVVLGALTWAILGTAATALIPTSDSAQPLLALSFYPVILLSGVFGPIGDQPGWLTTLVDYLPARPLIHAAVRALEPAAGPALAGRDLAVLLGWAVAGLLMSVSFFRWHPRRPTRRAGSGPDRSRPPAGGVDRPGT